MIYADGVPVNVTSFEQKRVERVVVPTGEIEVRWREHEHFDIEHTAKIEIAVGEWRRPELRDGK